MEIENGFLHRPLESRHDTPADNGSPEFWQFEKNRQEKLLSTLRFIKPGFDLAKRDPYSLRIGLSLILIAAFLISGDLALERLRNGLSLKKIATQSSAPPFAQIRITPPAYTGLKPLVLNQPSEASVKIIQGSRIHAEIRKGSELFGKTPILKMGDTKIPFKDKKTIWEAESPIAKSEKLSISTLSFPRFKQKITYLEDRPPSIEWKDAPFILPNGEIRLALDVTEDYGIEKIVLRGILPPGTPRLRYGQDIYEAKMVSLPVRNGKALLAPVFDLTGHPWAGRRISLMAEIYDFVGNTAYTVPFEFFLPQRQFRNPVAVRLSEIRLRLLNGESGPREEIMPLGEILLNPQLYAWDSITTLALRSAIGRLLYAQKDADIESVSATLWQIAMRLETGNSGETQKNLDAALEKLQQALQNGEREQAAQAMQQVLQALSHHLQSLSQAMKKSSGPHMTPDIDMKALGDFLKEIENEIRNGDIGSALEKVAQLQNLSQAMQAASQGLPEDIQKTLKAMENLADITKRQQDVLDDTRTGNAKPEEQKSILQDLEALQEKLPHSPKGLEKAGTEMQKSANAFNNKNMQASIPHQEAALKHLRETAQQMRKDLQQKLQNMMSLSGNPTQRDPLGRNVNDLQDDGTEIPEQGQPKKADDVIRILRERSGDMTRSQQERDYYQRLLKQW